MKRSLLAVLLCGSASLVRADFTYQETTQMTGGSMLSMLRALGPLTRAAREPIVSTHIVRGNRMATVTKDRVSIIDMDKENITTIDTAKKTYSVMTFAEMKQAMEDAAKRMQGRQKSKGGEKGDDVQAKFKISAKATGQTRTLQGLSAKEMLITMAMESTNAKTGDSGAMEVSTDAWYAPVPGYGEVKEFHKKMAVKLGNTFGSGMQQISQMAAAQGGQANMSESMEQVAKELAKIDGVPVESVVKMGASGTTAGGSTSAAQPEPEEKKSGSPSIAGAALGRLGGFGRHRKDDQAKDDAPSSSQQSGSGPLMEMTMNLTSFSSGAADASKFEVPAGYKQVEPDLRRPPR